MVHANDLDPGPSVEAWIARLLAAPGLGSRLEPSFDDQVDQGYGHTLREICQQPVTWLETAARMARSRALVDATLEAAGAHDGRGALVLTGSGSSLYAGECLAVPLQQALKIPVNAVAAGQLLTHPEGSLPPDGPYAVVSFARSGNSPESRAVVDSLLEDQDRASHLIITCNRQGTLATEYRDVARVRAVVLDEKTDDKSLVMTSSFTNMVLAGGALGHLAAGVGHAARAHALAARAARVLLEDGQTIEDVARSGFSSAVYLASGCRMGAAREASLKMIEMNDGDVWALPESYLGLRHGPMSAIGERTLVVAFLSSDPLVRAYETDVIRELDRKKLGSGRLVVGSGVPPDLAGPRGSIVDGDVSAALDDEDLVLIDVLVGQLLAFFRCVDAGHRPDSPSSDGVISRVVSGFEIHRRS
jgi:D-galactosamine 6-phosphate deaminase/isomerase